MPMSKLSILVVFPRSGDAGQQDISSPWKYGSPATTSSVRSGLAGAGAAGAPKLAFAVP